MSTSVRPRPQVVLLNPADNVCIATGNLDGGAKITVGPHRVTLTGGVKLGHEIALQNLNVGDRVLRYGQIIGFATQPVLAGDWIHTHNIAAGEFTRTYEYATHVPPPPAPITGRTFQGYRRADGRVGTRNYIAVISTVNCSASVSKYVA